MWKIKKVISKGDYNYALVPEHPFATRNGYVLLHRVVIENHLGRVLKRSEVVHHKNHNKKDNRVENLEVLDASEHCRRHGLEQGRKMVTLRCPICGKLFERQIRQTHLVKPSKYGCTCCSSECRGKLCKEIQTHGVTHTMETAISANVLTSYKDLRGKITPRKPTYEGFRRDYTQSTCNGEEIVQTTTLVLLMVTEM